MSGHKGIWELMCLGTVMYVHNHVWAQTCLGTNVCVDKRGWAQTCVLTNVAGHKRVWAQSCGHKRGGTFVNSWKLASDKNILVIIWVVTCNILVEQMCLRYATITSVDIVEAYNVFFYYYFFVLETLDLRALFLYWELILTWFFKITTYCEIHNTTNT